MASVFSSGNLVVDRRFVFAEGMALGGDLVAAVEVLADAMTLAPDWAAGWFRIGEWLEASGQPEKAIAAWDRALAADPADVLGAGLKRDLARRVPLAETLPSAFVETLFDQYASDFDASLQDRLDYRAPQHLRRVILADGPARFDRAMDLGCGTGLTGETLRDLCAWLEGCDISGGMLAQARAKNLYDRLTKADIDHLDVGPRFDLIVAADVFVYIGALERIIGWCAGSAAPGGRLAFTVEESFDDALVLRESRRFAHSADYVRGVLGAAGFRIQHEDRVTLRRDRGSDIAGLVIVARHAATTPEILGDGEDMAAL